MVEVLHDPKADNEEPTVIYNPAEELEKLGVAQPDSSGIFIKMLLYCLLGLAILVDIMGIIATALDLGTVGIGGWILRIIFAIFKVFYLGIFWYLSSVFDYKGGAAGAQKTATKIKKGAKKFIQDIEKTSKIFIWLTRSLGITSMASSFIPILGGVIDVLPIETLNVVFLFFIWPNIASR